MEQVSWIHIPPITPIAIGAATPGERALAFVRVESPNEERALCSELERRGYQTSTFAGPFALFRLYEETGRPSLLLTDDLLSICVAKSLSSSTPLMIWVVADAEDNEFIERAEAVGATLAITR